MHIKNIEDLPIELQRLYTEIKSENDAIQASKLDYVEIKKNILDNTETLDYLEQDNDQDFDEYDENTFDMNVISPSMREIFDK